MYRVKVWSLMVYALMQQAVIRFAVGAQDLIYKLAYMTYSYEVN